MSIAQLDTENADRDLTSLITVLTDTPSATVPMLCQGYVELGDGAKDLDGSGGNFNLVVTVGGQTVQASPEVVVFGTEVRSSMWTEIFPVPANKEVILRVLSPNGADTDVDVTAYLYDVGAIEEMLTSADVLTEVKTGTLSLRQFSKETYYECGSWDGAQAGVLTVEFSGTFNPGNGYISLTSWDTFTGGGSTYLGTLDDSKVWTKSGTWTVPKEYGTLGLEIGYVTAPGDLTITINNSYLGSTPRVITIPVFVCSSENAFFPTADGSYPLMYGRITAEDAPADIWAHIVESTGSITAEQIMRAVLAFVAGDRAGGGTATISFKRADGLANAILMQNVTADGDTTTITLDLD